MHNTLQLSEMRTPHYSVKQIDFAVPLVQNSLDNADAGRPLAQDCPAPLIDSPTGHCTNTGMHSFSLWLFFPAIVQQRRPVERAFVALNGTSMHCHAYWKYTRNLWSKDTSFTQDTLDGTNGVCIIEVPLYMVVPGFLCISTGSNNWKL